jgi:hypothetical protein
MDAASGNTVENVRSDNRRLRLHPLERRFQRHSKTFESLEQDNIRSDRGTANVGRFLREGSNARHNAVYIREQPLRRIRAGVATTTPQLTGTEWYSRSEKIVTGAIYAASSLMKSTWTSDVTATEPENSRLCYFGRAPRTCRRWISFLRRNDPFPRCRPGSPSKTYRES